ncbi:MAG TPA: hypothetical protein VE935_16500, partial [Burkholderiales bacterium]|nr:hypothetical protein [Burkholderiales bacterium]
MAAAFVALSLAGAAVERTVFGMAAVFWLLVAPLWLARGMSVERRDGLLLAGFVVVLPAALAMTWLDAQRLLVVLVLVWVADS